jgi:hypothetical protein
MAPWANTEHRLALEEVKPTLDIFPLGKVLWSMVSGRKNLEYWYYARLANGSLPANFLPALFPNDPGMHVINEILAKCIVEHEKDCLKSAVELLDLVDGAIASLRPAGLRPPDGAPWRCRICGKGHYRDTELRAKIRANQLPHGLHLETEFPVAVYVCDNLNCRHVEFIFAVAP